MIIYAETQRRTIRSSLQKCGLHQGRWRDFSASWKKIIKLLTGQKAVIIYEAHLKYIDKKIIIDTFDQCGFKDIKIISTKELLDKNKYYIEINNNYIITYYKNKYEFIKNNNYIDLEKIMQLITENLCEDFLLIGINKDINEIAKINNNMYYLEDSETYFINKILKNNKIG